MRSMHRVGVTVLAATLAATLGLVTASPANAAPDPHGVVAAADQQAGVETFVDAAIKLESSVVRRSDGTLRLRTTAAKAGVSQQVFDQVAANLRVVNRGVRGGDLVTTPDLRVLPAGPTVMHNGVMYHWWGMEVHFNANTTNDVIGIMTIGGGLVTYLSGLFGGPAAAAIAGLVVAIGVGAMLICSNPNGVKLFKPYVGPPWCSGH